MWLMIGYGNLLRQDDGAGYQVAEMLKKQLDPRAAKVLAVHQLTPELVLELAAENVERVLFIDARRGQDQPLIMRKLDPTLATGSCGHQLAPELLLHMAHALYHCSPQAWLLTLAAQQLDMGARFSHKTQAAITTAVTLIEAMLCCNEQSVQSPRHQGVQGNLFSDF